MMVQIIFNMIIGKCLRCRRFMIEAGSLMCLMQHKLNNKSDSTGTFKGN